jgi:hypothetical protein
LVLEVSEVWQPRDENQTRRVVDEEVDSAAGMKTISARATALPFSEMGSWMDRIRVAF